MPRRILAVALLIGFILLLINLLVFRFMLEASWAVYFIIVVAYLYIWMKNRRDRED